MHRQTRRCGARRSCTRPAISTLRIRSAKSRPFWCSTPTPATLTIQPPWVSTGPRSGPTLAPCAISTAPPRTTWAPMPCCGRWDSLMPPPIPLWCRGLPPAATVTRAAQRTFPRRHRAVLRRDWATGRWSSAGLARSGSTTTSGSGPVLVTTPGPCLLCSRICRSSINSPTTLPPQLAAGWCPRAAMRTALR